MRVDTAVTELASLVRRVGRSPIGGRTTANCSARATRKKHDVHAARADRPRSRFNIVSAQTMLVNEKRTDIAFYERWARPKD
jgi:hypothetical protein